MALDKGDKIKVIRPFYVSGVVKKVGEVLTVGKDIDIHDANGVMFGNKATKDLNWKPEEKAAKPESGKAAK